jgi:hypothetical protein
LVVESARCNNRRYLEDWEKIEKYRQAQEFQFTTKSTSQDFNFLTFSIQGDGLLLSEKRIAL